jgi:hypothetical protein
MNRGSGSKSFVLVTIGRGHWQILMWLLSFNHKCRCLYYVACDSVEDVLAGFTSTHLEPSMRFCHRPLYLFRYLGYKYKYLSYKGSIHF